MNGESILAGVIFAEARTRTIHIWITRSFFVSGFTNDAAALLGVNNVFVLRLKTWSSRDETQPENCENTGDGGLVVHFLNVVMTK